MDYTFMYLLHIQAAVGS